LKRGSLGKEVEKKRGGLKKERQIFFEIRKEGEE